MVYAVKQFDIHVIFIHEVNCARSTQNIHFKLLYCYIFRSVMLYLLYSDFSEALVHYAILTSYETWLQSTSYCCVDFVLCYSSDNNHNPTMFNNTIEYIYCIY